MVKVRLFRNIHFRGCIHIGPSGHTSFCIHSSKDHPCSGIQVCYLPERHIPNPNKYVQMNCTPDPRLHTQLEGFIQCKEFVLDLKKLAIDLELDCCFHESIDVIKSIIFKFSALEILYD